MKLSQCFILLICTYVSRYTATAPVYVDVEYVEPGENVVLRVRHPFCYHLDINFDFAKESNDWENSYHVKKPCMFLVEFERIWANKIWFLQLSYTGLYINVKIIGSGDLCTLCT